MKSPVSSVSSFYKRTTSLLLHATHRATGSDEDHILWQCVSKPHLLHCLAVCEQTSPFALPGSVGAELDLLHCRPSPACLDARLAIAMAGWGGPCRPAPAEVHGT